MWRATKAVKSSWVILAKIILTTMGIGFCSWDARPFSALKRAYPGKSRAVKKAQMLFLEGIGHRPQVRRNSGKSTTPPYKGKAQSVRRLIGGMSPASSLSARHNAVHMTMRMNVKGKPITMETAWSAVNESNPPETRHAIPTAPSVRAQKMRWLTWASRPFAAIKSTTKEPLSEDVMKYSPVSYTHLTLPTKLEV